MLLPAIQSARSKTLSSSCKSNLKQIGIGVLMYSDDNAGYMQSNNIDSSAHFSPGMVYYLASYLDVAVDEDDPLQTDLRGTVFDEPDLDGGVSGGIQYPVAAGYGWNWRYMGYKQVHANSIFTPKSFAMLQDPSERMLAGDTADTTSFEGHVYFRHQNIGFRHEMKINVLHGDGSSAIVNSIPLQSNNNSKWWYGDSAH